MQLFRESGKPETNKQPLTTHESAHVPANPRFLCVSICLSFLHSLASSIRSIPKAMQSLEIFYCEDFTLDFSLLK